MAARDGVAADLVAEAAAVGFPDSIKGEVILCFVVLGPGHEPTNSLRADLIAQVID